MVSVEVGEFAVEALAGEGGQGVGHVPARVSRAVRIYLADRDSERPGWRYPGFLGHPDAPARARLELEVDDALWAEFEAEACRQGVSVEQLTEHAALYLAAAVNAGRITERILDGLEGED